MPKQIKELVKGYCNNPAQVSVTPESTTAERVDQYLFMVQQNEKQSLIELILTGKHPVPGKLERVLIFTRTKHGADRVVKKLRQVNVESNAIHGNKSQPQRQRALDEFRRGKTPVLIATDVAARGIDIPGVSHVINYELPNVPEQYVHRIGRTARAGADGIAIAFCAEDERSYLKDIRKVSDAQFERLDLPENFRAVVDGVGPTKPAPKKQQQRVKPKRFGEKSEGGNSKPKQKHGSRKGRPQGKPYGERSEGDRAQGDRPQGDRPRSDKPRSEKPRGDRPRGGRPNGGRPGGNRGRSGGRPSGSGNGGGRSRSSHR